MRLSYDYFGKHNLPYKKVGKLIVAQTPEQVKQIADLYDRGLKNNVPELKIIEKDDINKYEAKCKGEKAIWSPWTGIVDWGNVCHFFAKEFEKMGGNIILNYQVTGFKETKESKGSQELAPISVLSKNNVRIIFKSPPT